MEKRLFRSERNRVLLGVCGGLGEYFNADPVIVRVIAVLIIFFTGIFPGLIAYFIMALIIPSESSSASTPGDSFRENLSEMKNHSEQMGEEIRTTFASKESPSGSTTDIHPVVTRPPSQSSSNSGMIILAGIIIAIGIFFLLVNFFGWFWSRLWPVWLIIGGIIILVLVFSRGRK